MKIDTALFNNEKRYQLEGYFIVGTILSRDFSDVYVFLMPRLLRYVVCLFVLFGRPPSTIDAFSDTICDGGRAIRRKHDK
jgi:hypothetical protein